jgi:hypothetical protein
MLSKMQIIDGILQINQSARREWLALFDLGALRRYFEHLQWMLEPRGRSSRWERPGETPAIVAYTPQD